MSTLVDDPVTGYSGHVTSLEGAHQELDPAEASEAFRFEARRFGSSPAYVVTGDAASGSVAGERSYYADCDESLVEPRFISTARLMMTAGTKTPAAAIKTIGGTVSSEPSQRPTTMTAAIPPQSSVSRV